MPRTTPTITPTKLDRAYLAGIIDGEGCITAVILSRRSEVQPVVSITNTDLRLMEWVSSRWPGWLEPMGRRTSIGRRECYRFITRSADLVTMLTDVLPYLILKREQADLVLELIKTQWHPGQNRRQSGYARYTAVEREQRLALARQVQRLNHGREHDGDPDSVSYRAAIRSARAARRADAASRQSELW
jgi:hypothetical protein